MTHIAAAQLANANLRWLPDNHIDLACGAGALALCFGLVLSIAMFQIQRPRR